MRCGEHTFCSIRFDELKGQDKFSVTVELLNLLPCQKQSVFRERIGPSDQTVSTSICQPKANFIRPIK